MNTITLSDETFHLGKPIWKHPIGGRIKSTPKDFVVIELNSDNTRIDEQDRRDDEGGLFLTGNAHKIGTDQGKLIRVLSEVFGVSESEVSTSGLKDANAETTQRFSVFKPKNIPEDPFTYSEDILLSKFRYQREKVYPGSMGGNYFKISIRECNTNKLDSEELTNFITRGILNYYGYQRFGSLRPVTALIGRELVNSNHKTAIQLLLGGRSYGNDEKWRKQWRDNQDPITLLREWKELPIVERNILNSLKESPNNYQKASSTIPQYLRHMFASAFISGLTNEYLQIRGPELIPIKGERKKNRNIEIALPSSKWHAPLNDVWKQVFDNFSLELTELKSIRHTTRDLLLLPTDFKLLEQQEAELTLEFKLNNGCYATTLLREIMQSNPLCYV